MTEIRKQHPVVYSAVAVAVGMAGMLLLSWLWELGIDAGPLAGVGWLGAILVKAVPIVLGAALLASTGMIALLRPSGAGFGRGLACGAILLVFFGVMGLYAIANVVMGEAEVNLAVIVTAVFYFLLVGAGEEILARAVAAETLLEHFGLTHGGIVKACVASGVIFGAMHIVNIVSMDVPSVLMQMMTTAGAGMVFGAIYFRSGNLWVCVLLHMLWDASLLAATTSASFADAAASTGGGNPVGSVIFFAVLVGVALFLLRKGRVGQVQEAWAGAIETPATESPAAEAPAAESPASEAPAAEK